MRSLLILLVAVAPVAAAPGVRIHDTDATTTEGDTTVDGDPAAVFAVVADFAKWIEIFPDVAKVIVTDRKGTDAHVTLVAPDGHRDNLKFHTTPQARMVFFEDTGGRAEVWAEIVFVAGELPGTTRVHSKLFAEVKGVASLVVADSDVRRMRQAKVESQLVHLRRYFSRSARASVP